VEKEKHIGHVFGSMVKNFLGPVLRKVKAFLLGDFEVE